jgi:hypothetical protein
VREHLAAGGLAALLERGLAALLARAEEDRLALAAGEGLGEGGARPPGWRPFGPERFLGGWLRAAGGAGARGDAEVTGPGAAETSHDAAATEAAPAPAAS